MCRGTALSSPIYLSHTGWTLPLIQQSHGLHMTWSCSITGWHECHVLASALQCICSNFLIYSCLLQFCSLQLHFLFSCFFLYVFVYQESAISSCHLPKSMYSSACLSCCTPIGMPLSQRGCLPGSWECFWIAAKHFALAWNISMCAGWELPVLDIQWPKNIPATHKDNYLAKKLYNKTK